LIYSLFLSFLLTLQLHNLPNPPGTIKVGENQYVDKQPVTNVDWKEYMFYYRRDSLNYSSLMPDTNILFKGKPYFNDLKYSKYPVVGVSVSQIIKYFLWRSMFVTYAIRDKSGNFDSKYYKEMRKLDPNNDYKVEYQLAFKENLAYPKLKYSKYIQYEVTTKGIQKTGNENYFNRDSVFTFRCCAYYMKIK
jgi:hypothetical protein